MKILAILPRVYLKDFDEGLKFYIGFFGQEPNFMFNIGDIRLARFEQILLLSDDPVINHTKATIVVDSITDAKRYIEASGGKIIVEPEPAPTGIKIIASHPDGNIFEYIEPKRTS